MSKKAVILVNLGTPTSPTAKGVKEFLTAFLSDKRVVEAPKLIWWFVLRMIVIPLRKKKVAAAYQEIWMDEGSPLAVISEQQITAVQQLLTEKYGDQSPVVKKAMTYGEPSIANIISALQSDGIEEFLMIPMYPQFSASTTGAIYDQVAILTRKSRNIPDIKIIKSFQQHSGYINALVDRVKTHWQKHGKGQKLLMSFHGIPKEYSDKGDPYEQHCQDTANAVAHALALSPDEWSLSFQSRFGPKEWLQPYTDTVLENWAKEGIKHVDIMSPAFVVDCLETLEEINMGYKALFLSAGGERYHYIPCLNDSKLFMEFLVELTEKNLFLIN